MTLIKRLFERKTAAFHEADPTSLTDEDLDVITTPTYSLGRDTNTPLGSYALLSPLRKTISISPSQKNTDGHSGLLIVGWGGTGKTVLANTIAYEASLAGQKVIRYYEHDCEYKPSFEGTESYIKAQDFDEALSALRNSETCAPTVVVIDSIESYLANSVRFDSYDGDEAGEKLHKLVTLKTEIEQRFPDKVLFVFVSSTGISSESLSLLNANVGLTVAGNIYAHYKIGELLRDHPSRDFYLISQLKVGEFAVIGKEISVFRSCAVQKDLAISN